MKYVLTIIMLKALSATCQISTPQKLTPLTVVGKIAPMGAFVAELSYQLNNADEKDTIYTLRFNNLKYKHIDAIESVRFSGINNTLNELYNIFKSVFTEENKKNKNYLVNFTLGKDVVAISNYKSMGVTSAMFLIKDAYFTLTEKQIDKLFGKN